MRFLSLALVAICGCGRIGFDDPLAQDAAGQIGEVDAAAGDTVDADTRARIATGPFDEAVLVPELSDPTLNDDDPSLTGDMLELYLKRNSAGPTGLDIFVSTRSSTTDDWSLPTRADDLSSDSADDTPEVSADGLTIYFSSDRDGNTDVFRSTRATRSSPWTVPQRVPELSSADADYAVTTDGAGLNLTMTRSISGGLDLLAATRSTVLEPWSDPAVITELSSELYEADSVLDESGLHIFFVATTEDGTVGRQLVTASRVSLDDPFGSPTLLEGVNTNDNDEDPWISSDLTTLYFVRNTASGQDIYVATRPLDP